MLRLPRMRAPLAPRTANMFLATSAAALMIAAEPNALAFDFTDTFSASLGRYGAASVKDMTTPGNNFEGVPDDLLSFIGTIKFTRSADGVLRYRAHNLVLQSEDFSNAAWIKTRATISADVSAAPSGGVTADKLVEDTAASNSHLVSQTNINVVAGAPYVHRIRMKAAGRTWVALGETMSDAGGSSRQTFFNLGTGAVGSTNAAHAPSIVPLGNGWYDCSIAFTGGVGGSTRSVQIVLASSDGVSTYTGDGVSGVYLWGEHTYKTPADSTYLATTTAAKSGLPYEWGANLTDGTNNTQTVTVRATTSVYNKTTYLVSYSGAGSVALSGGTTGAVTSGTPFYFTSSTTSLVLTVTGSIANLQVREFLGVLIEPQATNVFLNSTNGATQTIAVTNGAAYTVSFYGTGSITFSGANSSTLSGTGANNRVSNTFTTASTSLVCTVSGSISYVQVETGSIATSPIITYGATATRASDVAYILTSAFPYTQNAATVFWRVYGAFPQTTTGGVNRPIAMTLTDNLANTDNAQTFVTSGGTVLSYRVTAAGVQGVASNGTQTLANNAPNRHAHAFSPADFAAYTNGALDKTGSPTLPTAINRVYLIGNTVGSVSGTVYLQQALIVPRRMSNAELQAITA